jgi:hypothetical protein
MSKVSIYKDLEKVSTSYHEGGGAVIIADDPQKAWNDYWLGVSKEHSSNEVYVEFTEITLPPPDYVYETDTSEDKVIIFPDSGCC